MPKEIETTTPAELDKQLREALQTIKRLQEENDRKEAELLAARAEVSKVRAEGAGWLITTPSEIYDGVTCGIVFENGAGWVSVSGDYEHGKVPHTPKVEVTAMEQRAKANDPAAKEALALYHAREQMSSAQRLVENLTKDFGYTATWYDGNDPSALREVLSMRAQQAKEKSDLLERARRQAEAMTQPVYGR